MISINSGVVRCPRAEEMMKNLEVMTIHVGNMPKIVKGRKFKGSVFSLMDLLSKKYRFRYTSLQARSFNHMVNNVSVNCRYKKEWRGN